jgi:rhodanese-related sulfurtransferase
MFAVATIQIVHGSPYTDIDVATAYDMITNGSYPNLVVLDVRNQSEYDTGHLNNSILIPVIELQARIAEIAPYKDSEVIVICQTGGRSAMASGILDSNNFTMVYNVLGGISGWELAGYPVVPEFSSPVMMPVFVLTTLLAVVVCRRKRGVKMRVKT